jgi:hypothetical protein
MHDFRDWVSYCPDPEFQAVLGHGTETVLDCVGRVAGFPGGEAMVGVRHANSLQTKIDRPVFSFLRQRGAYLRPQVSALEKSECADGLDEFMGGN